MTRENSSFKFCTLLSGCCRRQAALVTLSFVSLIAALPVYMILYIQAELRFYDNTNAEERKDLVESIRNALLQDQFSNFVLILLAVVAGIAVFRYLHARNQTDFFHALPITRGQIFAVRLTTGLLAVIPAYLINVILACGVCAAYGYADAIDGKLLAYSILAHLAGFLLIYAVSVLAAVLCGHTLVAILTCGWLQFGAFAGWYAVYYLLNILYPARYAYVVHFPLWLSPPMEIFQTTTALNTWWTIDEINYLTECVLPSLASLAAAVVILVLCYVLHRKRKSENTGLSIAFPIIELPFKLYMVSVVGIVCGLIFETTTSNWIVMFLGMAIGAFVTACVIEIVYDLDFHSLFRRWKSLLVYAVVCVVVVGCMAADITHRNSVLPDREDIVAADMLSSHSAWNCGTSDDFYGVRNTFLGLPLGVDSTEDGDTPKLLTSEEAIDAIYNSAQFGAALMRGDRSTIRENEGYSITFTLKNGKTFRRTYYAPYDTEQMDENGAKVRFSQEYLETRTSIAQAESRKEQMVFLMAGNYTDMAALTSGRIEDSSAISAVLQTLKDESMAITADYVSGHAPVAMMRVMTKDAREQSGQSMRWDYSGVSGMYDIPIYECETETIAQLQQYIKDFTPGFGDISNIQSISVTSYDEEDDTEIQETYTEPQDIAEWSARLVPDAFQPVLDPVLDCRYDNVTVRLANGGYIDCMQVYSGKE